MSAPCALRSHLYLYNQRFAMDALGPSRTTDALTGPFCTRVL